MTDSIIRREIGNKEILSKIFSEENFSNLSTKKVEFSDIYFKDELVVELQELNERQYAKYIIRSDDGKLRIRLPFEIHFINCLFEKNVRFENIQFDSQLDFFHCEFIGTLLLRGNIIKKEIDIGSSKFSDGVGFIGNKIDDLNIAEIKSNGLLFTANSIKTWLLYSVICSDYIEVNYDKENEQNLFCEKSCFKRFRISGRNTTGEINITDSKIDILSVEDFINEGRLVMTNIKPSEECEESFFIISNSHLGKSQFHLLALRQYNGVFLFNNNLLETSFFGTLWPKEIYSNKGAGAFLNADQRECLKDARQQSKYDQKETYRQLKYLMDKQGDRLNEVMFYEREMNIHNKLLPWSWPWKDTFWDKIILHASRMFSRYGQSILRPLFWLLAFNALFFFVLAYWHQFKGITIEFTGTYIPGTFTEGLGQYFALLNPTRKIDDSLTGWAIFWDLISRVSAGFFLYNIIRATRRFVK